jgi:hypothetical protein
MKKLIAVGILGALLAVSGFADGAVQSKASLLSAESEKLIVKTASSTTSFQNLSSSTNRLLTLLSSILKTMNANSLGVIRRVG